jgi:hypothetical protein
LNPGHRSFPCSCPNSAPSRSQAPLGNAVREAPLPRDAVAKRSGALRACVPKQSLGTRCWERDVNACIIRFPAAHQRIFASRRSRVCVTIRPGFPDPDQGSPWSLRRRSISPPLSPPMLT